MAKIVLVPGSWLGAWAWTDVTERLRTAGHEVHPLTLTGMGDRAHLGSPETDLDTHVQDVVAALEMQDLGDVILVGHSYAGVVVTLVADRARDRIRRLVYLAGLIPQDGVALIDANGPEVREILEQVVRDRGDGWKLPVQDDKELTTYWGDHGMTGDVLARFRSHVVGQPFGTYRQVVRVGQGAASLPRTYVNCTADVLQPPADDGEDGWQVVDLAAGHWPMFTRPAETAALLDRIAQQA